MENNYLHLKKDISTDKLLIAEADAYFCFEKFLGNNKLNFMKGFPGIESNFKKIQQKLKIFHPKLYQHFCK